MKPDAEFLAASINYHRSLSSISLFIPEIEKSIVLCKFYPNLEEIERVFE